MSPTRTADIAVVGSGISGVFVARELVRKGREVTIIERGGRKSHAEQLSDRSWERELPTSDHNHDSHPEEDPHPWDYLYVVGGSSLHWGGVATRFLPSDFEMRSRFGVGRDWPVSYEEMVPFYEAAERAMHVAGGPNSFYPGTLRYPQPSHPLSPVDRLVAPLLEPFYSLPQARPTRPVNGRPACCGSALCGLCPVDARYSVLHTLADERLLERPELTLRERTVVARLRVHRRRVVALECVGADGERSTIRANTVVLAANGIENPGLLLRSDIGGDDVGRWLYDHIHRPVTFGLNRPVRHGRGNSLLTGHSFAWIDGEWRTRRSALEVSVFNPGLQLAAWLAVELAAGGRGAKAHRAMRERFDRTLVLDTLSEDLPRRDRFVELSPQKDRFGLPKNRIRYGPDSDYVESALPVAIQDLRRRLQPLGGRNATIQIGARGGHQLGTCYMGDGRGVVDPNLRHHQIENLYITGGSAFPTYSAHHPTLTIAALAIRLGRHLAAQAP